jgi:predicted transport protein
VHLTDVVKKVLANAEKLKASNAGNEANTKVLLIEPLLAALGWDPGDLDAVEREYRVYDKTCLDYALKIDGKARLFVEAKGVGKNLDDKQFIAQTVNYANNEGVLWCVLTNGLTYRVYKTNEPVPMEQKLLFEVDLGAANGATTLDMAKSLELIARQSIVDEALDHWGERVFTDGRVRKALGQLAAQPTTPFLNELGKLLGKPEISTDKLRESLARVLDAESLQTPKPSEATPTVHKPKPPVGNPPGGSKEYPLDHHLAGKPAAIVDSFEQLDQFGRELGADVTRRVRKQYVGYFAGKKSFFTIEVQRQRVLVYLNLDPTTVQPWDESAMRDVANIGHFGMGDTEYSVRQTTDLDGARALIKRAYETTTS